MINVIFKDVVGNRSSSTTIKKTVKAVDIRWEIKSDYMVFNALQETKSLNKELMKFDFNNDIICAIFPEPVVEETRDKLEDILSSAQFLAKKEGYGNRASDYILVITSDITRDTNDITLGLTRDGTNYDEHNIATWSGLIMNEFVSYPDKKKVG